VAESPVVGANAVTLAHLEIFAEVLVTAPPVKVHHAEALGTQSLMEVRVAHIVLFTVGRESPVSAAERLLGVGLAQMPAPALNHLLLLVLHHDVHDERLVQMECESHPHEPHSVLVVEHVHLPVAVAQRVLHEARDVLERSPFLRLVTRLLGAADELLEVAVGLFGKGSGIKSGEMGLIILLTFRSCPHAR